MADDLRAPDEEPVLVDPENPRLLDDLNRDELRVLVKTWVLWWACRQDAPTQVSARKALTAIVGGSVRREYRKRWVQGVFNWLSDRPTSLRDQHAVRAFICDKQMVLASRAARAASQAIPTEREMSDGAGKLDSDAIKSLSKVASDLGNMAIKGFDGVAKLLHLDKLPPDVDLDHHEVDELLELLERAIASFDEDQHGRLRQLARADRSADADVDTASMAGL